MVATLKLADNLLDALKAGEGNSNTIREGDRDIEPGVLIFEGTESGEKIPVNVTRVVKKKLEELTDEEAHANGETSAEASIEGMIRLYESLGRPMTRESMITVIDYNPIRNIVPAELDWTTDAEDRWRGGSAFARWTIDGEKFTKRDGVEATTKGGEVAILKPGSVNEDHPLGEIDWSLPKAVAEKSYHIQTLPKDKLDRTPAKIERIAQKAQVLTFDEPVWFTSPFAEDHGAPRILNVGDALEFNPQATPPFSPVQKELFPTRYITEAAAKAGSLGVG